MDRAVSVRKFEAEVRSLQEETAGFVAARGWTIVAAEYPVLAVIYRHPGTARQIEFRFTCDDWDQVAPSLTLHDATDGRELAWEEWPKGGWSAGSPHPLTGKPFLCLPGIREYHSHSSHIGDTWDGYRLRGTYRLRDILERVYQRFGDTGG